LDTYYFIFCEISDRVEQLQRQVMQLGRLGTIFNQTLMALQSESAILGHFYHNIDLFEKTREIELLSTVIKNTLLSYRSDLKCQGKDALLSLALLHNIVAVKNICPPKIENKTWDQTISQNV
jgi:hypothetical protein